MSEHVSTERMNDALDGLLNAAEIDRLDDHVAGCPACREEYARLSETVAAIRSLPGAATPPAGLWAGIEARIEGRVPDVGAGADVVRLPTAATSAPSRRVSFSVPQLAAAAVLISVLSAGSVWLALAGRGASQGVVPLASEAPASPVTMATARYSEAVVELEAILAQGRELLAPETLQVIETSLGTVDEAMADVEQALAEDPSSEILARMLESHQRTKLKVLRQAATAIRASI